MVPIDGAIQSVENEAKGLGLDRCHQWVDRETVDFQVSDQVALFQEIPSWVHTIQEASFVRLQEWHTLIQEERKS